jgi:hypothetical protein
MHDFVREESRVRKILQAVMEMEMELSKMERKFSNPSY